MGKGESSGKVIYTKTFWLINVSPIPKHKKPTDKTKIEFQKQRLVAMKQKNLFLAFLRVGLLGYGGGPSSIPLVHAEVVSKYKWMNDDEFADVLALGNTLPGPIATKMAGYIGYRVAGITGMINAVLATIVPTILLMIVLLTSLASFKEQSWVAGMTDAVLPVVGVMLAVLTWDFFKKSQSGLGAGKTIALIITSIVLIEAAGLHPGFLIGGLLLYALVKPAKSQGAQLVSKGAENGKMCSTEDNRDRPSDQVNSSKTTETDADKTQDEGDRSS